MCLHLVLTIFCIKKLDSRMINDFLTFVFNFQKCKQGVIQVRFHLFLTVFVGKKLDLRVIKDSLKLFSFFKNVILLPLGTRF